MLLEVRDLVKNYGSINALGGISFELEQGQVVGLLGPNGSGKTTLLKIIAGLINNYSGEILFNGMRLGVDAKADIAYLPDVNVVPNAWSVKKAIGYFSDFFDDFDKQKAERILDDLEIDTSSQFSTLSKGMKEKLQLSLVLSRSAKLYIFDEPIAGVDPVARDVIFNLIVQNYNKEASVIISTHLVASIEKILDRVIFLRYGEIIENDMMENLKLKYEQKDLESIFKEIF